MPCDKDEKNRSIVSAGGQGLIKYSSDLIRRGLKLIEKIEQKDKSIIPYRKKIIPENAAQVKLLEELQIDAYVYEVKFSPDGNILAVASSRGIDLYDVNSLEILLSIETSFGDFGIGCLAFNPDGTLLAYGDGHVVRLLCVPDGFLVHELSDFKATTRFRNIEFSPDGIILASLSFDFNNEDPFLIGLHSYNIHFWRVSDGSVIRNNVIRNTIVNNIIPRGERITSIAFSPDGNVFATGATKAVWLWRFPECYFLRELKVCVNDGIYNDAAFSLDDEAEDDGANDIDLITFNRAGTILAGVANPNDIYICNRGSTIFLWRVSDGLLLHELKRPDVQSIALSPDGNILASGEELNILEGKPPYSVLYLWSVTDCLPLCKLEGHKGQILSLAFNPDGDILATGSIDGTVRLWGY